MNKAECHATKAMWEAGHNCADIAYVLDRSPRTVRRCIDSGYQATGKQDQIADRIEKFAPIGSGNYRTVCVKWDGESISRTQDSLDPVVNEPEAHAIAIQEVELRLRQESYWDVLTVGC